ncbi:DNA-directed RNA polymerase subunit L [Thermoplasma volcanium]|uniref:DNA-directed RNA polymerase subunit Rpo11 n=1 Tax=Thermoplasma volcanium (strain ATCC 51530 / DSM 4299 / JCM 9571 / NBRC 15438 / GSS1) TaxID=273116 RepID=RPO11_THEVO|nr:DNA-directed RNA polymerase subunit L [Thermoplasma volcanium]Q978F5.2 RecName: Full=DNA-directed RNA polymerase subunit Rpo11; AltName: Full=DNA-directed RNA polymerase subunit L [Thermoplasma volcanium GSS1]
MQRERTNETSLRVVSKEKDSIIVEMINYDNTLLRTLVEEILKDDQVIEARYYIKHPIIDNPQIYVKVKSGKPQAAIKRSIRKLSKLYEDLGAQVEKEIEKYRSNHIIKTTE